MTREALRFEAHFSSEGWEGSLPTLGIRVSASNYKVLRDLAVSAAAEATGVDEEAVELERFLEVPRDISPILDVWQQARKAAEDARRTEIQTLVELVDVLAARYQRSQRDAAQIIGIHQPTLNKILKRAEAKKAS